MRELVDSIRSWGDERGIFMHGTRTGQLDKLEEEFNELVNADIEDDRAAIADSVGDMVVVLIMYCELCRLNFEDCVRGAYNEILKRKGKMVDGKFVKEVE